MERITLSIATLMLLCMACSHTPSARAEMPTKATKLTWGPCPEDLPGLPGRACATVSVPLLWDQPVGEQIEIFVQRYLSSPDVTQGQLWVIDGGPGGTGVGLVEGMESRVPLFTGQGWDVYVPTHRGTGLSTALECGGETTPLETDQDHRDCVDELTDRWGSGLAGFSTSEAARDIGHLVGSTRDGRPVFLYGESYGTYVVQRYLKVFPDQADGVLLEGVLDLNAEIWQSDSLVDEVGLSLMDMCAADATCNEALGGDPRAFLEETFESLRAGDCEYVEPEEADELLPMLLNEVISSGYQSRILVPALIQRLQLCTDESIAQFDDFLDAEFPEEDIDWFKIGNDKDDESAFINDVLGTQVIRHDLLGTLETLPRLEATPGYFAPPGAEDEYNAILEFWPHTPQPEHAYEQADTDIPMLMLSGGLDLQTYPEWARDTAAAFDGPNQHLVFFPTAGHGVLETTPLPNGESCATAIVMDFLANPTAGAPDISCREDIVPLDFGGRTGEVRDMTYDLFGTSLFLDESDLW